MILFKLIRERLLIKLVLLYFFASTSIVALITLTNNFLIRKEVINNTYSDLGISVGFKQSELDRWIESVKYQLFTLRSTSYVIEYAEILQNSPTDSAEYKQAQESLRRDFSLLNQISQHILSISLLSPSGIVIASSETSKLGDYLGMGNQTTYFRADQSDVNVVPTFYTTGNSNQLLMTFTTDVLDSDGKRIGYLTADLNINMIDELIRQNPSKDKAVDPLLIPDTFLIGKINNKNAFLSVASKNSEIVETHNQIIPPILQAKSEKGLYVNSWGVPVIGVYNWIEKYNLALVAELKQEDVFYVLRRATKGLIITGLGGGAILLLAVYLLSLKITKPILAITHAAEDIAEGNTTARAPVLTQDEIGSLATTFNQMTDRLNSSLETLAEKNHELEKAQQDLEVANVGLEKKVQERTRELEKTIEEAKSARAEAEAANATKSIFLANMSHELRTPLNAIIGYSEMLIEESEELEPEEFVPDLDKIQRSGKHLLTLINDLLDLSKIEAGKMDLYLETFSVDDLIEDIVATINPLVQNNNNQLILENQTSQLMLRADLTKVRQSILNLLSNAAKFTHEGSISLRIESYREEGQDWIKFAVQDSGIGLSPEQLAKLFQPFTQADASTTRKYGGTGLGLALSRQFCQLQGGDITVTSELGKGSCFVITLPMDKESV